MLARGGSPFAGHVGGRADVRARDDQNACCIRNGGLSLETANRSRGRRRRALCHANGRLPGAPTARFAGKTKPVFRRKLSEWTTPAVSELAVFSRHGIASSMPRVAAWCVQHLDGRAQRPAPRFRGRSRARGRFATSVDAHLHRARQKARARPGLLAPLRPRKPRKALLRAELRRTQHRHQSRESLGRDSTGLADFAFCRCRASAGGGAHASPGTVELQKRYLPRVARGDAPRGIRACPKRRAGSDVAGNAVPEARARRGSTTCSTARKTWISNGGIADFLLRILRPHAAGQRPDPTEPRRAGRHHRFRGRRRHTPGLSIAGAASDIISQPHPIGGPRPFTSGRIPAANRLRRGGRGVQELRCGTLDIFSHLGGGRPRSAFAQRALDESIVPGRSPRPHVRPPLGPIFN